MATQLSPAAYERLQKELDELTTEGRVRIARAIEAARALGDLSENGDYHAAKDEQGRMEARIRQLQATLRDAVIVEEVAAGDTVAVGSVVTIHSEFGDERVLVGSQEEEAGDVDYVVSPQSPLGEALVGTEVGDEVTYTLPNGDPATVKVVAIG